MIPLQRTGLVPDGKYKLLVTEVEKKPGKSGFDYIALTLVILDDDGRPMDSNIYDNLSLSPKSKFMVSNFLDAIQAPTEGEIHYKAFKGKKLYATIGKEAYQGKLKNVVTTFHTPEEMGFPEERLNESYEYVPTEDEDEESSGPKPFEWSDDVTEEVDSSSIVDEMPEEMEEGTDEDVKF
jgi:hypothetical protein